MTLIAQILRYYRLVLSWENLQVSRWKMQVAYLVNQYPKVSHSFIRREIQALEVRGVKVLRFSIRTCAAQLVDPLDQEELAKTQVILDVGIIRLLTALLQVTFSRPGNFFRSLQLAMQMGWGSDTGMIKHLIYLVEACVLLLQLVKAKVTHLHVHFGTNSTTVALLCKQLGGPNYSFTVHGPEEFDRAPQISLSEKILYADFVVAISEFGRSQLYRYSDRTQWDKIHVVHCGLDQEFLQQPITPVPEHHSLVCVGRLCEQKGQFILLSAVKQLIDKGENVHLTLVGDGEMRQPIEAFITENNLQQYVKITGWATQTDVQQYIHHARVFVLPSFAEGLPVVLMEALAMQRPVISTYVAGIPELIRHQVNGWLVPAGSVTALMTAIQQALNTPTEKLAYMGSIGRDDVNKQHNIDLISAQLIELFGLSSESNQIK